MKKVIFGLALLSFISTATMSCTRTKAKPECKKNIKKVKKMRKEGKIHM